MNDIRTMPDEELLRSTQITARREKFHSLRLIEHLLEVDDRKLYAASPLNYCSLFKYVSKELGYDEYTAYERIRAMRLVRRVPEVKEKIESGELNLASAARVESHRKNENLDAPKLAQLVEEVSNKTTEEVKSILLDKQSDQNPPREKVRQLPNKLKEAKIILSPELQAMITRYEELSGKTSIAQIMEKALVIYLKQNDPLQKVSRKKSVKVTAAAHTSKSESLSVGPVNQADPPAQLSPAVHEVSTVQVGRVVHEDPSAQSGLVVHEVPALQAVKVVPADQAFHSNRGIHSEPVSRFAPKQSRSELSRLALIQRGTMEQAVNHGIFESNSKRCVSPEDRDTRYADVDTEQKIWTRSQGQCEHRDRVTGIRCETRYRVELDHYPIPHAMGGLTIYENLRHACRAHNARFAVEVFGVALSRHRTEI